jgi:hypothetical protein
LNALKRSAAGISLILAISLLLLLSDWNERKTVASASSRPDGSTAAIAAPNGTPGRVFKAGVVYFARDIGTDLCVQGLIDGLRASGLEEGNNLELRRSDDGTIRLAGRDITRWPEHARAHLIGRVFQNPFSGTAPALTICGNLSLAARRGCGRGMGWGLKKSLLARMH